MKINNDRIILITAALLTGAAQATTIIGPGIGNGDFEATEPDAAGPEMYVATPSWFNASSPGEGVNFTTDAQTYGSPQSGSRAGMPYRDRIQINGSGYTVTQAGISFDLSYAFGRTGAQWGGEEVFRTFLFSTSDPVNGPFDESQITPFAVVDYDIPMDGAVYSLVETNGFYTTTGADVGKTFYFGMVLLDTGEIPVYPRVDVIELTANDGIDTPEPPAGERISIISGALGNGDFEANLIPEANENQYAWYQVTPGWVNLSGEENLNFVTTLNTDGNAQPNSQCGLPWDDRVSANETGYTVTHTGTLFRVSYSFGRVLTGWSQDEQMRVFLFTCPDGVDNDTEVSDITVIAEDIYTFPTDEFFTYYQSPWFYETTAADIGKTLYLGLELLNPAGGNVFPRIDIVKWQRIGGELPDFEHLKAKKIISGSLGDGDFEYPEPYEGPLPFTNSPNWFNASANETVNFSRDIETPSRSAMPYHERLQVNNTGHEVTLAGEVFNLSYDFTASVGSYDGDEALRTFLFTATAPIDGYLTAADMTEVVEVIYDHPNGNSTLQTNAFYTSTEADIGKTLYFGMEHLNPSGGPAYPRIDNVDWSVLVPVDGSITNLMPNGWNRFMTQYQLAGGMFADTDGDGVLDVFEFAHGGNPTNPAEQGMLPYMTYGSGGSVTLTSRETIQTNAGIYYTTEWTDNLASGAWHTVWVQTNETAVGTNYVDRMVSLDGEPHDELFMRTRLFGSADRPNILLIMADDLGYNDVGFNGSTEIITPQLDQLAAEGMVFSSAYVAHPFCGPSRMGLLSGRYPHEIGGPYNLPDYSTGDYTNWGLSTRETTIASVLQSAGYYTGIMGKWHVGQTEAYHPNNRGFEEFYGFLGGGKEYFGPYLAPPGYDYDIQPQFNGVFDDSLTENDYLTDVLTDYGVAFIEEAAERPQPFFLFMSYNAPHTPLQAKQSDMDLFPGLSGDRKTYAGMVYGMDRGVGELVTALQQTGQYTNTLIVFLSDNGGRSDAGASNAPLRGNKGDTSEGGFRVPMFVHWPGVIASNSTFTHPVTALDFYPTFAELAEAVIPEGKELSGKNIWNDLLAGTNPRPGEPIYSVRYRSAFNATGETDVGIRVDNWKALKWYGRDWQLFDLETDIHEDVDVSTNSPANQTILSDMVLEAELWSAGHITPLWFDNEAGEKDWYEKGMPHYDEIFSSSLQ